jgi:protein TonB
VISKAAGLKGNPGQFFGPDAYPPSAQREGAEGRVVAKLTVGTDGRVTECVVTTSSNNRALDDTTCRIAKARVRFSPALDNAGNPITSSYTLPVRWQLPQE